MSEHPIKQLLIDTRKHWDQEGTPTHVRRTFWKVIHCGTEVLGAEVYASESESRLVFHTCKSKFCTSCGHRATEAWRESIADVLPEIPYVGITLTLPKEFRAILQRNPKVLHCMPAMGAEAVKQWAWADYGVHLIINVVQQTFGGRLNFVPHLHMTVSAGGLHESTGCWIHRIEYKNREVMLAWRYAVGAFLSEAFRKGVLKSNLSRKEFRALLEAQHQRPWNVFVSRCSPKHYWLKHDGRYIRRPPVAQHRLQLVGDDEVEYWAKDTRKKSHVLVRHKRTEFVDMLIQHVTGPGSHSMRYFGLLSPRSKARLWAAIFVLLHQKQRSRPPRLTWRSLLMKTFGTDPLLDSHGQLMRWTGRRQPIAPSA